MVDWSCGPDIYFLKRVLRSIWKKFTQVCILPAFTYILFLYVSCVVPTIKFWGKSKVNQNLLPSSLLSKKKKLKIKICRNIILPIVLYGCKTWSLTLGEERRQRLFANRVLKGIFESKRYELPREWRKLHDEKLNDLYCSPNIVRVMKSRRDGLDM